MASVRNHIEQRAADVAKATEFIVSKTKDLQIIKSYLSGKMGIGKLTPIQQDKLNRYQFIYNQFVSHKYTETEIVNMIKVLYNIEYAQAYIDINATKEIFSSVLNINKMFELKMELESAKQLKQVCVSIGDTKGAAMFQKNIIAIASLLQDTDDTANEGFEGHTIEATFNPSLLGVPEIPKGDLLDLLKRINEKRGKKLDIDIAIFKDVPDDK